MQKLSRYFEPALALWISFVFLQSLFFKFSDAPEPQYIFSTLEAWAAGYGVSGLFLPPGPFSAYGIGVAELIASVLLLSGVFLPRDKLKFAGAILSVAIMTGAIFFHLFTPLGIVVEGPGVPSDGGTLFIMACTVWISGMILLIRNRRAFA